MICSVEIRNFGTISHLKIGDLHLLPQPIMILGPNRVGKSTLIDCMAFALIGDFPSKSGSPYDRVSYGKGVGSVILEIEINNNKYRIERVVDVKAKSQKAKVYLDGKLISGPLTSDTNKFIEENIVSRSLFLMTNYCSQFKKGDFSVIEPADRKKVLSDMIGLQFGSFLPSLIEKKKECDREITKLQGMFETLNEEVDVKELEKELEGATSQISKLQGELQTIEISKTSLNNNLKQLRGEIEVYNLGINRSLELNKKIEGAETFIEEYGIDDNPEYLSDLKKEQVRIGEVLDILKTDYQTKFSLLETLKRNKWEKERELVSLKKESEKLMGIPCKGVGKFSGCRFIKDAVEAQNKLPSLIVPDEEEINKIEGELNKVLGNINDIDASIKQNTFIIAAITSNPAILNVSDFKKELLSLNINRDQGDLIQTRIDETEEQIIVFDAEQKFLYSQLSEMVGIQSGVKAQLDEWEKKKGRKAEVSKQLIQRGKRQKGFELLVTGFGPKGISPLLLEISIPEINNTANELLNEVSNGELSLSLSTTKQVNKGKEERETLSINVLCSDGREGDLSEFSGGEQTLIGTCLRLSLIIYNMKRGKNIEVLWLDEITGSLDPDFSQNIMKLLSKLLETIPQVFVISHQQSTFSSEGTTIQLSLEGDKMKYSVV